jgi:cytochrome P450
MTAKDKVPASGPSGYPVVGHLPHFLRDKLGFLVSCAGNHPDVVQLKIGAATFLLNNPEDIGHVLVANHSHYEKSPRIVSGKGSLFGTALIGTPGGAHRQKRQTLQPLFHRKAIARFGAGVVSEAESSLAKWKSGAELDVSEEMRSLSVEIIIRTLFGTLPGKKIRLLSEVFETRRRYIEQLFDSLLPFAEYFPSRRNAGYKHATKQFDDITFREIKRQQSSIEPDSFLGMLMQARYDDGRGLSDEEIRDEMLTLALAGYETIAEALTWTWYLLSQNPEEELKLWKELDEVLAGRVPSLNDIQNLRYTSMILAESMRLYPPTWLFVRVALEDDRLPSGTEIPRGSKIYLSPYITQRDPRYYTEPDKFNPQRFGEDEKRSRPKFAYFPFGGGPRQCIGEAFATMEGVLLIATIGSRFKLELSQGQTVSLDAGITLRPRNGLRMKVNPR